MNDQRKAVFEQRQEFMEATDLSEIIAEMRHDMVADLVARHLPPKAYAEQWDIEGLNERVPRRSWAWTCRSGDWAAEEGIANEEIEERITEAADARAAEREALIGAEQMRGLEKNFLLQMIDLQWREHLMHLDHLRNVIGLRGYGQRDPLNEYKTEAFSLFEKLLVDLRHNVTRWLMTVRVRRCRARAACRSPAGLTEVHLDPLTGENAATAGVLPEGLSPRAARGPAGLGPAGRLGTHRPQRSPAPAARARSSSTATGRWSRPRNTGTDRTGKGRRQDPIAAGACGGKLPARSVARAGAGADADDGGPDQESRHHLGRGAPRRLAGRRRAHHRGGAGPDRGPAVPPSCG